MELTAAASWLNTAMAGFDQSVTLAVHKLYEMTNGVVMTPLMNFISLLGAHGIFLIILSLALLLMKKTRRFGTGMAIGLALGAILVNVFLKNIVARPRPYADVEGFFYPLWVMMGQHVESDLSFPSGHTNAAFATMVPVFLLGDKRKSWLALIFAVLMGVSRIYRVVHYPTDVVGGLITGTVSGIVGALVAINLPKKWYRWDLFQKEETKRPSHLAR